MSAATIRLFLVHGEARRLRTAEISNWSGKSLAAPRTELDALLRREELEKPGVYLLFGASPESNEPACYIGEAEVLRDRLKQHRAKDFWVHAVVFVSKDENLTKSHIRYLEGRLIADAQAAERFEVLNSQGSGSRLPESDRAEMEEFLRKLAQLLPVLGFDPLTPRPSSSNTSTGSADVLELRIRGLVSRGRRTESGFLVFEGSQAVSEPRPSAAKRAPSILRLRDELLESGQMATDGTSLVLQQDIEFSSPSTAASVLQGGNANGLVAWKTPDGRTLKELEESESGNEVETTDPS